MADDRYTRRNLVVTLKAGRYDSFIGIIFSLCSKSQSDSMNRARLVTAFPEVVEVWEAWYNSKDPDKWFKQELGEDDAG